MIQLNNVTLVTIDTEPDVIPLTRAAARETLKIINPKDFIFFGNEPLGLGERYYPINRFRSSKEYARFLLKNLWPFITTTHIITIHWDGFPTNEVRWRSEFLDYDYIGAPWIWSFEGFNIGNGGFSIRSKKLLDLCASDIVDLDWEYFGGGEDVMIGIKHRKFLENNNCKFPSPLLAAQFSYEAGPLNENAFGFHSPVNIPLYASENYLMENAEYLFKKIKANAQGKEILMNCEFKNYYRFIESFRAFNENRMP